MAVSGGGVNRLRGKLVRSQGGVEARRGRSQGMSAVQSGGRGAETGGGALVRLVLQEHTQGSNKDMDG